MISRSALSSAYQPIFLFYYTKKEYQIDIIRFIVKFFTSVKKLRPDWNDPENSLLSKGMGVAALLKTLQLIFPIIFIDKWQKDASKFRSCTPDELAQYIEGIQSVDFSREGEFGGVGSAGSINKIKEQIITNSIFLGKPSYNSFEDKYRTKYLPVFKNWLRVNAKDATAAKFF